MTKHIPIRIIGTSMDPLSDDSWNDSAFQHQMVEVETVPPKRMAYFASAYLVDPKTVTDWLRVASVKKSNEFLEEYRKLITEHQVLRDRFLIKQAKRTWLDKLLGL